MTDENASNETGSLEIKRLERSDTRLDLIIENSFGVASSQALR
jgi:hypothetical protein